MNIIYLSTILIALTSQSVFANDRLAIEKIISQYGQAMSASDTQTVVKLFSEDGVFIPANLPAATGLREIEKAYEHEFTVLDLDVKAIIDEIEV